MATSRIIPMHISKGTSIAQCLADRIDYSMNPDKTNDGQFVTSYACNASIADAEFLYSKRQYEAITGRTPKNDVIAYQLRQSFKPGEISPELANKIAYDLAMKFTHGNHAFIVCTHTDKKHIHAHIIFNSTALDCTRKFRNFWGSAKAVRRISDRLCLENGLSIVENPKPSRGSYDTWLGDEKQPSQRDLLRTAIDAALSDKTKDFDAFVALLIEAGYEFKPGKSPGFRLPGQKNFTHLRALGDGYSLDEISAVIVGKRQHTPHDPLKKYAAKKEAPRVNMLIDIQAKLQEGKGAGYERWAAVFNLKQMAQTLNFLQENSLLEYDALSTKVGELTARYDELLGEIKSAEKRMAELAVLQKHIVNYSKTRDTYVAYRKAGYSKRFLAEHESEIVLHKAAKKAFDDAGLKKLPTVKALRAEYAELLAGKKQAFGEFTRVRDDKRAALVAKANVDKILGKEAAAPKQEKDRQR